MNKEEARKYLQQLYPNGWHCWLDEQRIEAIGMAINALQEDPVSIWHGMSEEAENGRNIIIIDPKDFYGAVLRKGGSQLRNHNKERYVKWAYIDDIINVTNKEWLVSEQNISNVERTVKNWKEEPVSEELEKAAKRYATEGDEISGLYIIEEEVEAFKAGAQWQEDKDKQTLNEEGVVVLPEEEFERMKRSLIKLAEMEQQMMAKAIDVEVKVDAGGYPYIPQMELYDYDKDIPLAKEGDKYKVILIKQIEL